MGTFTSTKDLEKVKGIGPKTLAKLEPFITI
jgi:DNA uptake protein ComE-like DNA-binding protein